jgi:hypothetical protein
MDRGNLQQTSNERAKGELDLGVIALTERNVRRAIQHFMDAESLGHDPELCSSYRWKCWMLLGEFENAWRESDLITARGLVDPNALWDGEAFDGRRIVVRCLHGYGDSIQFLRYAGLLRDRARRVIVQTHPEMLTLLSGLVGADSVVTWDHPCASPGADWDQQIEVTELPRVFRTTISTIPCKIPYLRVSPQAVSRSMAHLRDSGKRRVGLLWAASAWNPARSIRLEALLPLLQVAGCEFYSFQRGPQRAELDALPRNRSLLDTALHAPDIADTAADLMNMDLLITVDTMAAHLAGALGRPVWVMLPWDADWRWMVDKDDTPWYPTMRLFRQPAPGEWKPVIARIASALSSETRGQSGHCRAMA